MIWPLSVMFGRAPLPEARIQAANAAVASAARGRAHIEALAADIDSLISAANGEPRLLEDRRGNDENG